MGVKTPKSDFDRRPSEKNAPAVVGKMKGKGRGGTKAPVKQSKKHKSTGSGQ